jgi:predicted dehydrogenase
MTVWLMGTGLMAREYARVLDAVGTPFKVVGRGQPSADAFEKDTGIRPLVGDLSRTLSAAAPQDKAIVAVNVDQLCDVTLALLSHGIRSVLVEKPGGLCAEQIGVVARQAERQAASVFVGYNRRFLGSTLRAQEMIREDGGVSSITFDFTEWSDVIETLAHPLPVKENWILANSSHVIDLAFCLAGRPRDMRSFVSGTLPWHPSGAVFSGGGVTESGALFSYHANWTAPGRWGIDLLTPRRRLTMRPLETLVCQERRDQPACEIVLDGDRDASFKPGLYLQTSAFLAGGAGLLTIAGQYENAVWYEQIAGRRTRAQSPAGAA